ncbi:MAG: hypothetical protein NTZ60_02670 [Campylobacterales bacterium]|nr:hypothetical protein [Campylobacterales bacterium]
MKRISLQVDEDLHNFILTLCSISDLNVSELYRDFIKVGFDKTFLDVDIDLSKRCFFVDVQHVEAFRTLQTYFTRNAK